MADEYKTFRICGYCGGDGLVDGGVGPEYTCPLCSGDGEYLTDTIRFDPDGGKSLIRTYEILEATDVTEYGNLSDSNKNAYNMLLQCGIVDLADGAKVRANLWGMFDSESTTRANLITLLGE